MPSPTLSLNLNVNRFSQIQDFLARRGRRSGGHREAEGVYLGASRRRLVPRPGQAEGGAGGPPVDLWQDAQVHGKRNDFVLGLRLLWSGFGKRTCGLAGMSVQVMSYDDL